VFFATELPAREDRIPCAYFEHGDDLPLKIRWELAECGVIVTA
jgi:hypothetical protein